MFLSPLRGFCRCSLFTLRTEIWLKLLCSCAQSPVAFSICETSTRPFIHAHTHTQKLLLHKLFPTFNLRELYLFIICSQAALL